MASYSSSEDDGDVAPNLIDAREIVARATKKMKPSETLDEASLHFEVDLGNLAVSDHSHVTAGTSEAAAREAVQLLVHQLWDLPAQVTDTQVLVALPAGKTRLPREKPLPVLEKEATRWEAFAARKNMLAKPKRSRKVWDEETGDFVPRFGYGSKRNQEAEPWLVEVKGDTTDIESAMFQTRQQRKKHMAKQSKQELRNKAREKQHRVAKVIPGNTTVPSFRGLSKEEKQALKGRLKTQMEVTRKGTASLGKFDREFAGEPKRKKGKQKDKLPTTLSSEKDKTMRVLDRVLNTERDNSLNLKKQIARTINQKKRRRK